MRLAALLLLLAGCSGCGCAWHRLTHPCTYRAYETDPCCPPPPTAPINAPVGVSWHDYWTPVDPQGGHAYIGMGDGTRAAGNVTVGADGEWWCRRCWAVEDAAYLRAAEADVFAGMRR